MNNKINIQEIVDALAERNGITKKDADTFIRSMFDLIEDALEKDRYIKVKGLGTFKLIEVDERESVNVNTGERFLIEGHSKISFIPDNSLKEIINKPFAHFETVIVNNGVDLESIEDISNNHEKKINVEESNSTLGKNVIEEIKKEEDTSNNESEKKDSSVIESLITKKETLSNKTKESDKENFTTTSTENELSSIERKKKY